MNEVLIIYVVLSVLEEFGRDKNGLGQRNINTT